MATCASFRAGSSSGKPSKLQLDSKGLSGSLLMRTSGAPRPEYGQSVLLYSCEKHEVELYEIIEHFIWDSSYKRYRISGWTYFCALGAGGISAGPKPFKKEEKPAWTPRN